MAYGTGIIAQRTPLLDPYGTSGASGGGRIGPGYGAGGGGAVVTPQTQMEPVQQRDPAAPPGLDEATYQEWLRMRASEGMSPDQMGYGAAPGSLGGPMPAAPAPAASAPMGPQAGPSSMYGVPGYDQLLQLLNQRMTDVGARQDSAFRADQQGLIDRLGRYSTGEDSVSRLQLQQANDASARQQMAMAASARPGQGAMASRLASQNIGAGNTALAGQSAVAGLQERYAATQALQNLLSGARSQDLQYNQSQDAATNSTLQALLGLSGMQQQGGISEATNANNLAMAALGRPGTSDKLLATLGGALPYLSQLFGGKSSPTADPSYAGYGSAPY